MSFKKSRLKNRMNNRKPLAPLLDHENQNVSDISAKPRIRSKSSGLNLHTYNSENEDQYSELWNEEQMMKNLEQAINKTNEMNEKLAAELQNFENVEVDLENQILLNQKLYDQYMELKNLCQ